MNKNTKLWLGAGIVGVGAYLLFKSKKATTPALTASAPANLVGFDTGKFYDVRGGHAGVHGEGIFNNAAGKRRKGSVQVGDLYGGEFVPERTGSVQVEDLGGGFVNAGGWNPFRRKKKGSIEIGPLEGSFEPLGTRTGSVEIGEGYATGQGGEFVNAGGWPFRKKKPKLKGSIYVPPLDKGEFVTFANQPFNFGGSQVVGERKLSFADAIGDRQVSANGVGKDFFDPRTKKFTKKPPLRRIITPVEPERPVPVDLLPLNNFASLQGASGMINTFDVKSGFDPLVNR